MKHSESPVRSRRQFAMAGLSAGAPLLVPAAYRAKFTGRYDNRIISGGVGHNLPQEAPQAFAQAVIDVDHF